jgi:tRNA pseudouridine65 synthase
MTRCMTALQVLHRDHDIVAVDKPAGMLVHRSPLDAGETQFAMQLLRDQLGMRVYPAHRLDRPTSGVLLFALSPEAARSLGRSFADGQAHKTYLAVVRGWLPEQGCIDYALVEEPAFRADPARAREALSSRTSYRRLAVAERPWPSANHETSRYCLAAVFPHSGRTHQIRRHLKHVYHPVIGDVRHGDGLHNRHFRTRLGCERLLLHAAELSFPHPGTGERVTVRAPLGGEYLDVLDAMGWREAPEDSRRLPPSMGSGGIPT